MSATQILWQEYMNMQMSETDTPSPTKSSSKQQILDWIVAAQGHDL